MISLRMFVVMAMVGLVNVLAAEPDAKQGSQKAATVTTGDSGVQKERKVITVDASEFKERSGPTGIFWQYKSEDLVGWIEKKIDGRTDEVEVRVEFKSDTFEIMIPFLFKPYKGLLGKSAYITSRSGSSPKSNTNELNEYKTGRVLADKIIWNLKTSASNDTIDKLNELQINVRKFGRAVGKLCWIAGQRSDFAIMKKSIYDQINKNANLTHSGISQIVSGKRIQVNINQAFKDAVYDESPNF